MPDSGRLQQKVARGLSTEEEIARLAIEVLAQCPEHEKQAPG